MDDKRIIELFFARDEAALREVTKKYGKLCMHLAENFLSRREDREECHNDVLLELWNIAILNNHCTHSAMIFCFLILITLHIRCMQKFVCTVLTRLVKVLLIEHLDNGTLV